MAADDKSKHESVVQFFEQLQRDGLGKGTSAWNPLHAKKVYQRAQRVVDFALRMCPPPAAFENKRWVLRIARGYLVARALVLELTHPFRIWRRSGREAPRALLRAPGARMLRFTEAFCSKKANELIYQPLVADYREEYFEAMHAGSRLRAAAIKGRYRWAFIWILVGRKLVAPVVCLVTEWFRRGA